MSRWHIQTVWLPDDATRVAKARRRWRLCLPLGASSEGVDEARRVTCIWPSSIERAFGAYPRPAFGSTDSFWSRDYPSSRPFRSRFSPVTRTVLLATGIVRLDVPLELAVGRGVLPSTASAPFTCRELRPVCWRGLAMSRLMCSWAGLTVMIAASCEVNGDLAGHRDGSAIRLAGSCGEEPLGSY